MAKIRHCTELQHGPVVELFPGLQTNSNGQTNTDHTEKKRHNADSLLQTNSTGPEYLSDAEFTEHVRRQILRRETPSQPTADDDLGLPSCDEIAEAMGITRGKPKFRIERV